MHVLNAFQKLVAMDFYIILIVYPAVLLHENHMQFWLALNMHSIPILHLFSSFILSFNSVKEWL